MPRTLALLGLLAMSVVARAERTLVYRYEIAGTAVGESRTVMKDDGTFSGTTKANIGQVIESIFSGRTDGAAIPEWTVLLKTPTVLLNAKSTNDGATAEANDLPAPQQIGADAKLPGKVSIFAPYFMRTLAPIFRSATPAKRDIFYLDQLTKMPVTLVSVTGRKAGDKALTVGTVRLGPVEMEIALDATGEFVGLNVPVQKFRIVAEGFADAFVSPVDMHPELSKAMFATGRETVRVPLRDGVELATELIRPKTDAKVPTILIRTPYGRANEALGNGWYAPRGYAVVVQDCRGRGESGGEWDPFVHEARDGADAIAWIASQPWSDGKVGMIGASYGGFVQWAAASELPPALRCIVPQVSPPGSAMRNLPYLHGVPMLLPNLWWLRIVEKKDADLSFYAKGFPGAKALTTLPLARLDEAVFGHNLPIWDKWVHRDSAEKWPGYNFQPKLSKVSIPTLSISGYFDGDEIGTMLNWDVRREAGWTNQWLVYGPWPHGFNASTTFGGVDFGRDSQLDLDSIYLRFFDTYLKGRGVGWGQQPKVSAFLTGANRWIHADAWPLPESRDTSLYLAGSGAGKLGRLVAVPLANDAPTRYVYDPGRAKVPAALSAPQIELEGSLILRPEELPGERLTFRSMPFKSATNVAGPIRLQATIATSARSTDLFALVVDEGPDGRLRRIGQMGAFRVGSKDGGDRPGTVVPNRPMAVEVRLWDFAHQFSPGHRLTLLVMSDAFPAFARNLGTGEPIATGTRITVQRNTLYHDAKRPSRLRFRVVP